MGKVRNMANITIKYRDLWDHISTMKIVDSHNHLRDPEEYADGRIKPLFADESYLNVILNSLEEYSFSEGSFRNEGLSIICEQFAGDDTVTRQNLLKAREAIQKRYYKKGGFELMMDDAGIAYMLNDPCGITIPPVYPVNRMRFKIRMDFFTGICSYEDIKIIQDFTGSYIHTLDDLMEAAEKMLIEAKKQGATVIKNCQAYLRNLRFNNPIRSESEQCLNKVLGENKFAAWLRYTRYSPEEMRPLADFMIHYFCRLAAEHDMTVAFHTGPEYHFVIGPRNVLELGNLFKQYPEVRFNLMHGNLPNYQDAAYIANRMKNVSIDLCWCYNLSTTYSLEALYFWLGLAPINRIIGYGTDNNNIETIWWCSKLARKTVYQALARHIEEGRISESQAIRIATMMLYENPERILGFKKMEANLNDKS